jgi:hypothetical protein
MKSLKAIQRMLGGFLRYGLVVEIGRPCELGQWM